MGIITGLSRRTGCAQIPGGVVGEHSVPGNLKPGDALLSVLHITDGSPPTAVSRTGEFSITAGKGGSITNTTTNTTGGFLHVIWASAD